MMKIKEAKEIIQAGLAWADWTEEQREAMKVAWDSMNKIERYEKGINLAISQLKDSESNQFALDTLKKIKSN